jgi:hypothetical protein
MGCLGIIAPLYACKLSKRSQIVCLNNWQHAANWDRSATLAHLAPPTQAGNDRQAAFHQGTDSAP